MNLFAWAPFLLYFLIADEQVRAETDVLQIVGAYDQFFKMPDGLAEVIKKNETDGVSFW